MKKLLSTLMVIACLALAIPAQAQIKFGVKAGLNVSKLHLSKETLSSDIEASRIFLEFTYFIEPAVAYIESKLRTYSYVCTYQATESDSPSQVDRNFNALLCRSSFF